MKQVLNNFKNTYFKGLNHYFIEQIILLGTIIIFIESIFFLRTIIIFIESIFFIEKKYRVYTIATFYMS